MGVIEAEEEGHLARRKRPVVAALLSALLPGAGQWYAGRHRRALVMFAPLALIVVGSVATGAAVGLTDIASLLVQPRALWALFGGNLAVLAWRLFTVADAYLIASDRPTRTLATVVPLAVVLVAVAVPHAIAGAYGLRGIELLENVFPPEKDVQVLSATVTLPAADDEGGPVTFERGLRDVAVTEYQSLGLIFENGVGDPDAIAIYPRLTASASSGAPFVRFGERVDDRRITVLLAGGDEGPGRGGLRTDTMIVATVNVTSGQAALFGIPRNFGMVPLPHRFEEAFIDIEEEVWEEEQAELALIDENEDGFPDHWVDLDADGVPEPPEFESCECFPEILNALYGRTDGWWSRYPGTPDPGMEVLADTLGHLLDLHIDYWMLVNMEGFVKLIDAMGGVDLMVQEPLHVKVSAAEEGLPKAIVHVEPGLNHLTGTEALAYVRWRRGSSDYARMVRQRCMIRAVASEADPITILRSFTAIADAVQTSVVTNIPLTFLPDMVHVLAGIDFEDVATVGFVPPTYNDGRTLHGYPVPDVDRIRWKVDQVLANGAASQSKTGESECGI
ncbi:MAG: LCP family protein [Acidimicrobiia bacterium]